MSTAELDIKIDSSDVPNATKRLKDLEKQGKAAEAQADKLGGAFQDAAGRWRNASGKFMSDAEKAAAGIEGVNGAASGLSLTMKGLGAVSVAALAATAFEMAKLADQTNLLHSRVSRLAGDLPDVTFAWSALLETANESGASMSDTVKLWESLDQSVKATDAQIITLTATLQKLGKIGGASSEEMGNSLRQLSQSFAGGVVRAEEFNSVLEQTPEIWRRVATAQGISLGELRTKMLEGKLTADEVFNSLMSQVDSVNADFEKMPRTIEQASQALSNNFAGAVAALDNQIGTSKFLSKMLDALARGAAEFTLQIEAAPGAEASVALNEIDAQLTKMAESRAAYDAVVASGDSAAIAAMAMGGSSQEAMNRLRAQEIALLERRDQILGEMADREGGKAPPSAGSGMSSAASGPKTPPAVDDNEDKKAKRAADAAKRAYDAKISALAREQQAEEDDYQKRLASAGEFNARMDALDATALEKAANDRGQRMIENQMYFNNGLITEEQYQINLTAIKSKYTDERIAIEENELRAKQMLQSSMLGSASGFFDGMAGMASAAAGEQSGIYRATFALSKGFATAKAALDMQMAISDAMSKGFPQNIPLMAQAASAGAQIASTISGLNYSGAYDSGGNIPAGKFGIVGERGAEIVTGPATVTSRRDTKALIDGAGGSGGMTVYITQNIQGNGDQALAEVVDRATKNALNEVQRDFATNGRIRKTAGV